MTSNAVEERKQTNFTGKYLTFGLGNEFYGIPVLQVREIIKLVPITTVPQMPEAVKGVINLRGKIIPILDLRTKFGLTRVEQTERTCIIVAQVGSGSGGVMNMGLVVDAVEEVLNINASEIEETPDFGMAVDTTYIRGIAKVKGTVKILLEIDRVVTEEGKQLISAAVKAN
jgi:purine-binding chemotaxis protein CheW